jgi:hypothetical protein
MRKALPKKLYCRETSLIPMPLIGQEVDRKWETFVQTMSDLR